MSENLQEIIARVKSGTPAPTDIQALAAATQSEQVTLAARQQAVEIGGSAAESVILTGSNNQVIGLKSNDAAAFQNTLQQIKPASSQPGTQKTTFHRFSEVSKFDLTHLIDKCLGELLGKKGLIGLANPCGEKVFLKNFCDCLKHELGRSNIQIRQPLALNSQVISDSKAFEAIEQYKKLL